MYSIKDLSVMCGLTERTLRNYLKLGILDGEKENGVWRFNAEQIESFFNNDYVKAAISANRRAILFDYLNCAPKTENSACVVLHLPEDNATEIATFFCTAVNKRTNLKMTFDKNKGLNRVILVGDEKTVLDIYNEYYSLKK